MSYISERIAYVKGLAEGMELSNTSREGKILTELIDLLDELSDDHGHLHARQDELEEYVEAVDEDLNEVELFLFDEDDYELDDEGDEDVIFDIEDGYDDDNDGYYSVER